MTSNKDLSERDICTQFIVPALRKAGWDIERQVREEVFFTDGRIFVKWSKTARGERKRADFILYHRPNKQGVMNVRVDLSNLSNFVCQYP